MQQHLPSPKAPVVIGGIGGSGTRLVASALRELGFFLGPDLNASLDNLWCTLLLKRPRWLRSQLQHSGRGIDRALRILMNAMQGIPPRSLGERLFVWNAMRQMKRQGHDQEGNGRGQWAVDRAMSLFRAARHCPQPLMRWGWKEPNVHLVLPHLARNIPELRYIHVIRHGLDMAFNANQAQFWNWASLYGIEPEEDAPRARLEYWIRANRQAIDTAENLLGEQFLLVRYDDFCDAPLKQAKRLIAFLGLPAHPETVRRIASLCRPSLSGTSRCLRDLSVFSPEQLDVVRSFGFSEGA